jgi:LPXTG-motif cell wall-anchored protein
MNRQDLRTTAGVCALLTASVIPSLLIHTAAGAGVPNCGGQGAAPQPVPYTCVLPFKTIDGSEFAAGVQANGNTVVVGFQLKAARQVATPIHIVHHDGISGAGGPESEASGIIPAGALTAVLSVTDPCRAGQLDIKAVFVGNGDAIGRIGGPWIQNGVGCATSTTTTIISGSTVPATTAPATSTPDTSSSVPGSTVPGPTTSRPLSSVPGTTSSRALPATGRSSAPLVLLAGLFLALGGLVLTVRRRAS